MPLHLFLCRQDPVVRPCRLADRVDHQRVGGFTDAAAWYASPIVFEGRLYTMLFEVIRAGAAALGR